MIFLTLVKGCLAQVKVALTTPINPVEQGGILSIHCQVWHLNSDNHEVTILRTTGETRVSHQKLSVDESVLQGVDDRVFLAERQLMDGSSVYFLSITEATRADEGEYFCKILENGITIREVESASVHLGVTYYPGDSDPFCSSANFKADRPYLEGSTVSFNCSSATANPPVSLQWTSGKRRSQVIQTREFVVDERSYSTMTLTLSRSDDGEIFVCQMTSVLFPGKLQTCHIGPLEVTPGRDPYDPNAHHPSAGLITTSPLDNINNKKPPTSGGGDDNKKGLVTVNDCQELCPVQSRVIYWMVATVIAGALSLIFFIIAIALLVRYIRAPEMTRTDYITARHKTDDIYSELECRQRIGDGKVYMSLDKSAIIKPHALDSTTSPPYAFHYHDMPTVVKVSTPK